MKPKPKQKLQNKISQQIQAAYLLWLSRHPDVFDNGADWYVQNCVGDIIAWFNSLTTDTKERIEVKIYYDADGDEGREQDKKAEAKKRTQKVSRSPRHHRKPHRKGKR